MSNPITQENYTTKVTAGQNRMEAIVIHHWGDPATNPQFDAIVNHLAYSDVLVSAHFVAEAGRVAQLAYLTQITWHAMEANPATIGIENNPRCSTGDVNTLIDLIVDIWNTLGRRLPLLRHSDVVPTACPGRYGPMVESGELYNKCVLRQEGKYEMNPIDVWNVEIPNAPGNPTPARVILKSIDEYTGKQPERVWGQPIKNATDKDVPVKDVLRAIDRYTGNTYDTIHRQEEQIALLHRKLDAILDKLDIDPVN